MISILEFKGKRLIVSNIPKHIELISKHTNCLADNQIEYALWGDLYDYLTEYYEKVACELFGKQEIWCEGFFKIPEEYSEMVILDYCKFRLPV